MPEATRYNEVTAASPKLQLQIFNMENNRSHAFKNVVMHWKSGVRKCLSVFTQTKQIDFTLLYTQASAAVLRECYGSTFVFCFHFLERELQHMGDV